MRMQFVCLTCNYYLTDVNRELLLMTLAYIIINNNYCLIVQIIGVKLKYLVTCVWLTE